MDLKDRSPGVRQAVLTLWTLGFGALYFAVIPLGLVFLTEKLGWPRWELPGRLVAGPLSIAAGAGLVLHCNGLFARIGQGSIVPIDPARRLVVAGPYRYSRNPVYVGYLAVLVGIFLLSGDLLMLLYAVAFFFYLRFFVRLEEPDLLERFGDEYRQYQVSVPRWLGLPSGGRR